MARAAALRPLNVIVLAAGLIAFAFAQAWWMLPLTLVTYAALVSLAARDPFFQRKILHKSEVPIPPPKPSQTADDVSPERRARWLPRGETRQKVEAALVVYRKVVAAIEDADDVTREVLHDSIPRLHATADRLVDVARGREKAAEVVRDLQRDSGASAGSRENIRELEHRIDAADAEISATFDELLSLRAKVVRVSIDSANPDRADDLNASLHGLNARLEALGEVVSPQQGGFPREL